jgi:hypothetical protein
MSLVALCLFFVFPLHLANAFVTPPSGTWPMFRGGPALLGLAAGTLDKELSLLWSYKTGGPVKSSAAVVGGKVFIGSGDQHVHAVQLAGGKKLWSFKTEGEVESSPLVLDGRVFVGSSDGWFYALETDSGKLVWKYQTGDKILSSGNWLKSPKGDATWIVFGSYDNRLYCLDAATGRSNWVYETGNYINGSPAVANGLTVFGGCDAILHVLNLADGMKVKEIEAGAYIAASAALEGNRAYFGHYENESASTSRRARISGTTRTAASLTSVHPPSRATASSSVDATSGCIASRRRRANPSGFSALAARWTARPSWSATRLSLALMTGGSTWFRSRTARSCGATRLVNPSAVHPLWSMAR